MELKRESKAENERASYGQLFALLVIWWLVVMAFGFALANLVQQ